jgi:hypothetical protein
VTAEMHSYFAEWNFKRQLALSWRKKYVLFLLFFVGICV